ncbi:MAG: hypothetical protein WCM76_06145 [Bacteroidota bacterium]
MKSGITILRIAAIIIIALGFSGAAQAQLCGSGSSVNKGALTLTTSWQNNASTGSGDRIYWSFAATAGNVYSFSNCNGVSEETTINIHNSSLTNVAANAGNGPYCATSNASIDWTCPTTGTYYVQLVHTVVRNLTITKSYHINIVPVLLPEHRQLLSGLIPE